MQNEQLAVQLGKRTARIKNARMRLLLWLFLFCISTTLPIKGSPTNDSTNQPADAGYVNFNFDRVDIRLLSKLVGEMTGRRLVITDAVDGKVTIVTPGKIPCDEVYPLFLSVLEASGFTVVQKGEVYQVIAMPPREVTSAPICTTSSPTRNSEVITKVVKLQYVSADELKKILAPMVAGGKTGAIESFGSSNHLIITDTSGNITRLEQIIAQIDRAGSSTSIEVVKLTHASSDDIARQVMTAMSGSEKANTTPGRHQPQVPGISQSGPAEAIVVPAPQANALVLVGTTVQIKEMRRLVQMLDTEGLTNQGPLNAIFLKYLDATEASKSLTALLEKTVDKEQRHRISIEANNANNALIVNSSPRDFEWVGKLVEKLDQPPKQVMVEIIIAEMDVGKKLDVGVEWSTTEMPQNDKTVVVGKSRPGIDDTVMDIIGKQKGFPQGLTLGVAKGTHVEVGGVKVPIMPFLLRALAQNDDVKILANVPLWAQNNSEASVGVVENIPILKSTIEAGTGSARDFIQNIDRRDVGIKLKMTPHVNPDGAVTMQLKPSIEAIIDDGPPGKYTPTIAVREVSTTVTVPDKTTIAISGLIREDKITGIGKIPILGDIPVLGFFFRRTVERTRRTNLLIFVTPTIVDSIEAANELKKAYTQKTSLDKSATNVTVKTELNTAGG